MFQGLFGRNFKNKIHFLIKQPKVTKALPLILAIGKISISLLNACRFNIYKYILAFFNFKTDVITHGCKMWIFWNILTLFFLQINLTHKNRVKGFVKFWVLQPYSSSDRAIELKKSEFINYLNYKKEKQNLWKFHCSFNIYKCKTSQYNLSEILKIKLIF